MNEKHKRLIAFASSMIFLLIVVFISDDNAPHPNIEKAQELTAQDSRACGYLEYVGWNTENLEHCSEISKQPLTEDICLAQARMGAGGLPYDLSLFYEQVECYKALAKETLNPVYCQKIPEAMIATAKGHARFLELYLITGCVMEIAELKSDPALCKYIRSPLVEDKEDERYKCYSTVNAYLGNEDYPQKTKRYCSKIKNLRVRTRCMDDIYK